MSTPLGHFIRTIALPATHRCFAAGTAFAFRPGLTLLVGDQGCGKSTLIAALRACVAARAPASRDLVATLDLAPGVRVFARDFERENPRTQPAFGMGLGFSDRFQISSTRWSHGEAVRTMVRALDQIDDASPTTIVLDEPDGALSPRSVAALRDQLATLVARGVQVIAAVHHPWLIESVPEVLSLEHRRWMPSVEFLEAMRHPAAAPTPTAAP